MLIDTLNMATAVQFYEKVEDEALHLPREDRSKLASRLLESLDEDVELTPEWKAELDRRIQSIEDGTAKLIPHEEVMANVRARLGEAKKQRQSS